MKTNNLFICLFLSVLLFLGCDPEVNEPFEKNTDIPPQVSNIRVENLPGAAKINYTLPNDSNILYVLAVYTLSNGKEAQTKSSLYKSYVEVEGFSRAGEYTVKLYTVSRSEIKSEPVVVNINPSDAYVHEVFPTLNSNATFGGINLKFSNPLGLEYVLHTLVKDSTGTWVEYDRFYTSATERSYSIRGFEAEPTEFKFFFTDKWQNSSDTLSSTITPLFEEKFDKSLWKDAALPDDMNVGSYGPLSNLWNSTRGKIFFQRASTPGLDMPNWFTIDLGKEYIFGRMHVDYYTNSDGWMYAQGMPEFFEIWATNTPTINWDHWTKLGEFQCIKPSGAPLGTLTEEDRAQAKAGDSFEFEPNENAFRYVRFKTLKTFGNTKHMYLDELTFFGKAAE